MTVVVDASVAIKWFVPENMRDEALNLFEAEDRIAAPDLLIPEIANIAWKKATRDEITDTQARIIVSSIESSGIEIMSSFDVRNRAIEIALALNHPAYDCFYIAVAEKLDTTFITADDRLHTMVQNTEFDDLVRALSA